MKEATFLGNFKEVFYLDFAEPRGYIYHLLNEEDRIVYVGQTISIFTCIEKHVREAEKIFYKIRYWEVPREKMTEIVVEHIVFFNPLYNVSLPANEKYCSYEKAKTIYRNLKGKWTKIRRIINQKEWELQRGCLLFFEWEAISKILAEASNE